MLKVYCSHCGEELMGAVNRCWRCGRTFVAENNPDSLPPIRRRPIPLELVNKSLEELTAAAVQQASGAASQETAAAVVAETGEPLDDQPVLAAAVSPEPANADGGSPKGYLHHAPSVGSSGGPAPPLLPPARSRPATPYYAPPRAPVYPTNAGATGGAIAAVVLGVMALATIRFITPGALLISVLGVSMGVWGLYSDRRGVAVFGLLLCCVAMSISGFLSAVQLFELINGYSPFESDLPVESLEDTTSL